MNDFASVVVSMFPDHWNINEDPKRDSDASTLLVEHFDLISSRFPERSFVLDRFPKTIVDSKKAAFLALSFGFLEDNPLLRSSYFKEEQKFLRVFQLLWAYDHVWVETSLRYENTERLKEVLQHEQKEKIATAILNKLHHHDRDHVYLEELADLEVLLELGLREAVSSVFVFEKMQVCIWSNYELNMPMFIGNPESMELLGTIVTTEGLYLRDSHGESRWTVSK
ncbi:MAG: hypothetical protein DF221_00895 [Brevibacillus sp.]|nr:MAG: hypothetical protein DF221_00895 [Brevibacillus sp.]